MSEASGLPLLLSDEAEKHGYAAVTTCISTETERHIIASIERDMRGIQAVWIVARVAGNGTVNGVELGRKKGEIKTGD